MEMISRVLYYRRPGRRRGCPRRLPQIRTCPIKASGSSRRGLTCAALPVVVSWTADRGSMPPRCCPATDPRRGAPFPPPGSRGTSSPASQVLWSAPIPGRPSRPTSLPSQDGYHPVRLCLSLHTSPTPAWGQGCSGQATPGPVDIEGETGVPSSWRTPISVCHVQSTPVGLRAPDRYGAAAWPLVWEQQRLPRKVFRRSIVWLSDSLSTLRQAGCPVRRKTRFQPLVRRYWTGLSPAGFQRKVSECFVTSHPPSPSFAWRNPIDRRSEQHKRVNSLAGKRTYAGFLQRSRL